MKNLFSFLFKFSPGLVFIAICFSALTGVANTGLIAVINKVIAADTDITRSMIFLFLGLALLLPISRVASMVMVSVLSERAVLSLRMELGRQILQASLRRLETFGSDTLLASLTTDVQRVSMALGLIPVIVMNVAIYIACMIYLHWLYWPAGLMVLVASIVGFIIFQTLTLRANGYLMKAREQTTDLMRHFQAITQGTKELKQNRKRRNAFLEDMLHLTAASNSRLKVYGMTFFATASGINQLGFFLIIGAAAFLMPMYLPDLPREIVTGYSLALLYVLVPLESVSQMLPILVTAGISLKKVEGLGVTLEKVRNNETQELEEAKPNWKSLEYKGVTHSYHMEKEDRPFTLGPMDLSFQPGELVFLVGGNGSGKTTLAKLLVGLYHPEEGQVLFDGTAVENRNRDDFRQNFSTVFSDFYLFESMLGMDNPDLDKLVHEYLEKLQLNHKVSVKDGTLSTTNLSQGQRKRLALLNAYLEDRPLYLFDEWASDQDPLFKDVFYNTLLPDLKRRGKTVIVISHDDHYFHVADRLIKLNYGQLEFNRETTPAAS